MGKKTLIFSIICAALIVLDLVTKHLEEAQGWEAVIIPNFIEISSNIRNPGCAFSFLNDSPYGQPVLITLTMIMLPVMIAAIIFIPERFTLIKLALSLVIAGAVGNLVDRFAFHEVRDFFGLNMFGGLVYCNFADFFIVIGAIIAIVDLLFINEYSLIPLTKKAKEAQKMRESEEAQKAINSDKAIDENAQESTSEQDGGIAADDEAGSEQSIDKREEKVGDREQNDLADEGRTPEDGN